MLHYNFPPFSVGEVGFMRGAGRREIGHGALAERALSRRDSRTKTSFPTRCAWSATFSNRTVRARWHGLRRLAGADGCRRAAEGAGRGVAMGLVKEGDKYAILTDIAGAEDHYGDMDFKVAGTRDGITALQMDIKVPSITAADHARSAGAGAARPAVHSRQDGRGDRRAARRRCRQYAPRIYTLQIPTDKIRDVIGPGGKMIRGIIEQTGVKIDVEDDGTIHVASRRRSVGEQGASRSSATSPPRPRSARPISARWSGWSISARSSKSSPAPTACCTSAKSPRTASRTSATS